MEKHIRRIGLSFLVFIMAHCVTVGQQLPLFSQYVFNSLHVNPGYAGYKIDPFIQATYRSQYVDFPGAPKTFSISADMASSDEKMGFGASLSSDQIGAARTYQALLTYAYKIQTGSDSFLGLGVSAGASEYTLDGSMLSPDDLTDVTLPSGKLSLFTPNFNTGLFFHSERFFSGFSVYNLVGKRNFEGEDISLAFHHLHYYFQIGGLISVSDHVEFKPSILVREDFKDPTNFDLNAMFLLNQIIWTGVSYRSNLGTSVNSGQSILNNGNAIAAIVEVFATEQLRVGYAYDYNVNVLRNRRNSSHEISLGIYLGSKALNNNMLKCF